MNKLVIFILILFSACSPQSDNREVILAKEQIVIAEAEFAKMAKDVGIAEAFLHYAADSAVLQRGNTVIKGKNAIKEFLAKQEYGGVSLSWKPDYVDVAESGELGYTYGKYVYTYTDSLKGQQELTGIFHTVWKKQEDGSWKFVWD